MNAADPAQKRLVVELVREARPDVIITHAPDDYMGDHNEISKLVFECSFYATFANLETERPRHDRVTPIYYMDTDRRASVSCPTEYVDVSDVIDTKASMLEAHETQLDWLRDHDGVDIVEEMRTCGPLPRAAVRRPLRRGLHPVPHLAARHARRRLLP